MRTHSNREEIDTNEEDLLNYNDALQEESREPSPTRKVKSVSKSSAKHIKPVEREEQTTESETYHFG